MSNTDYRHVKKWEIQTYSTGSSIWETATSWPRGSVNPFMKRYVGTTRVLELADGNIGMITPTNRYNQESLTLSFYRRTVTDTFRTNIKSYLTDHTGVKLTLHDESNIEGYILSIDETWDFTGATQDFSISLEFQQFNVDGS